MVQELQLFEEATKKETYETLLPQIKSIIESESNLIANLANISAILKEAFNFLWVGFYIIDQNELVLGPFQGPLACTRIPVYPQPKGVCGFSAHEKKTYLVSDVNKFPGHIACSSQSLSEIVVPLVHNDETKLVLDIDSEILNNFDDDDQKYCERIIQIIKNHHF